MPSLIACPNCGEFNYHSSHMRNVFERLRKMFFRQKPYRCHNCNHRSWILVRVVRNKISIKNKVLYFGILIISIIIGLIIGSAIN